MLKNLFGKKEQKSLDTDPYKEIYCIYEYDGKSKVIVFRARRNYDKDNMICRNCKACE